MGYQLQEIQGARVYFLPGERQTLGRGQDAQICIDDPTISRTHAIIHVTPGGVWVEDLQSTNGSFVHQQRILSLTLVNTGDPLQFGGLHFQLGFTDLDSVPAPTLASNVLRISPKDMVRKTVPVPKGKTPANWSQEGTASGEAAVPEAGVVGPDSNASHAKRPRRLSFLWGILTGLAVGFMLGMAFCRISH